MDFAQQTITKQEQQPTHRHQGTVNLSAPDGQRFLFLSHRAEVSLALAVRVVQDEIRFCSKA
jgi:hypothetical protein